MVPGYAGVRSAKWLAAIRVQDAPSASPFQLHDYKLFPSDVTAETADWERGMTINESPLSAMICAPADGALLPVGRTLLRSWAIAGERGVARVELSGDGGRRWTQAALERPDSPWEWTLWRAELELPPGGCEIVARAWDTAGQTQPEDPATCWNFKGYLSAARHRIRVTAG